MMSVLLGTLSLSLAALAALVLTIAGIIPDIQSLLVGRMATGRGWHQRVLSYQCVCLWFLAIASMANGIIHPLFAFTIGGYFPGLWTSPFVGILGVALFLALSVAQSLSRERIRLS